MTVIVESAPLREIAPTRLKQCCAALYESDAAKLLLGDALHPGGTKLSERLAEMLKLGPNSHVLDVAAGRGTSALHLARGYGCKVTGIDYGQRNVDAANRLAESQGLAERVRFLQADAEGLPFDDSSFDAVICECAFCTFPDKPAAARECARVLRPGGQVGLSDLTRQGNLPAELESLLSWIACIADARPVAEYAGILAGAGFTAQQTEQHDEALHAFIKQVRGRLLVTEMMVGLKKLSLPGFDFAAANKFARDVLAAVARQELGYAILTAAKPPHSGALET